MSDNYSLFSVVFQNVWNILSGEIIFQVPKIEENETTNTTSTISNATETALPDDLLSAENVKNLVVDSTIAIAEEKNITVTVDHSNATVEPTVETVIEEEEKMELEGKFYAQL